MQVAYHLSLSRFLLRSLADLYPELPVGRFSDLAVFSVKDEVSIAFVLLLCAAASFTCPHTCMRFCFFCGRLWYIPIMRAVWRRRSGGGILSNHVQFLSYLAGSVAV